MKFNSVAACLMTVGVLSINGCSSPQAQNNTQGSGVAAGATDTTPTPTSAGFDYGDVLGTVHLKVKNKDGYRASMKVVMHKPTMRSSLQEIPAWCPPRVTTRTPDEKLTEASSIIFMTAETTVQLDPHEGSPAPLGWAPTVKPGMPNIEGPTADNPSNKYYKLEGYRGRGECSSISAPSLTEAGYDAVAIDMVHGRAIPSLPLPKTMEEVTFSKTDSFYLDIKNVTECTMLPNDEFIDGALNNDSFNSPEKNNGHCSFSFDLKTTA